MTWLDFMDSVSREFVLNCQALMPVLSDDTPAQAYRCNFHKAGKRSIRDRRKDILPTDCVDRFCK